MNKIIIFLLIITLFNGCGYKPQFGKNQKINFYISSIEFENNDKELEQFIRSNLNNYKKNKDGNNVIIKTLINYQKNPISKNVSGKVEEYELLASIKFTAEINKTIEELTVNEKFNMTNFEDEFDERNFERNIKRNMSRSITSKLVIWLTRLNDS